MNPGKFPLLVFGTDRSGSTSLMNLIQKRFNLAIPSHKLHYGSLENDLFARYKHYGNLTDKEKYVKFVEEIQADDFIKSTGIDKETLYSFKCKDYIDFFLNLMDEYTKRTGAEQWATKISLFFLHDAECFNELLDKIEKRYQGFNLIGIKRNFSTYLPSYLNLGGENYNKRRKFFYKYRRLFTGTVGYFIFNNLLQIFLKKHNGKLFEFEKYIVDSGCIIDYLSNFYNISFEAKQIEIKRNTSFQSKAPIELNVFDKFICNYIFGSTVLLPVWGKILRWYTNIKLAPKIYYRITLSYHYPDYLKRKLAEQNDALLIEYIEDK